MLFNELYKVKCYTGECMCDYQKLLKLYNEIDTLIEQRVDSNNKAFKIWKSKVKMLLTKIFGERSSELQEFKRFSFTLMFAFGHETDEEYIERCCEDLREVKPIIENFLEVIKEEDDVTMYVADANIKKKYQVFISSTYKDLIDERLAVTKCLLDNNCIPVGMEQFPANGMNQMEYIEKILDDCDYYILILAGKYGTLDKDDMGFTEKEYEYAKAKKIPVLSFVHRNIELLPMAKCEKSLDKIRKLEAFRNKVCNCGLVNFYDDINQLQLQVVTTINKCKEELPAAGWVRGVKPEMPVNLADRIKEAMREYDCGKNREDIVGLTPAEIDVVCK